MKRVYGKQQFYKMVFSDGYNIGCYAYDKHEAFSNLLYIAKSLGYFPLLYPITYDDSTLIYTVNNVPESSHD